MFIVFEGQDGAGKDVQAAKMKEYLEKQGRTVVHYAESGTASQDDFIRGIAQLNYGTANNIDERTHMLLYIVNRYEQWKKLAEPALKEGHDVLITRNWFSTLIYEGYGLGVSRPLITKLHKLIMPEFYFKPDKIVILTLDEKTRQERLISQGERKIEFFKSKDYKFKQKLNNAYLKVAEQFNVPTLNAAGTIDEVHEELKKLWKL